jgi:hypothetical protein
MASATTSSDGGRAAAAPPPATALTPRERAVAAAGRYVPDRCGGCGRVPARPLLCGSCRALVYCSPACQKADWREHKPHCTVTRANAYCLRMEDPAHEPAWAPLSYDASTTRLLRLAPGAFAASARTLTSTQLVSLLSMAILNLDAAVVGKVLPVAAAAGVRTTTASTSPPYTLLGLAADNCTRRWPTEQLARALDVLRLLVGATPAAALDRGRSLSSAPPRHKPEGHTRAPPFTLLEFACGDFNRALMDDAVAMLLQAGASVDPGSDVGAPEPWHLALVHGTATTLRMLLDAGAPPNARTRCSPLSFAPLHILGVQECPDAPEKARLLVAAGADVEAFDGLGRTPLATAAHCSCPRVFDALLDLGADVHAVMTYANFMNYSSASYINVRGCALHRAASSNDTAILRRLLAPEHRAAIDIEARSKQVERHREILFDGLTPLHFAALTGSVGSASKGWKGALELLLDAGADVLAESPIGHTPFTLAGSPIGHTPLTLAINSFHPDAVRLLLRAGGVRSEYKLGVARMVAETLLTRVKIAAAAGRDYAPERGSPTQQLIEDASAVFELLQAARVHAPGR